jgi:hypothetical protein
MSHFTTIHTQIKDIEALKAACRELGLELLENAQARGYADKTRQGEYVIRLKGPFDIALNRAPSGAYEFVADWWGGHIEKEAGKNGSRILQYYGVHKTTREAQRKGYMVSRQTLNDGSIKLTIGGFSP